MRIAQRFIDHIVYCVPDLEKANDFIESHLGVRPTIGGKHNNKGTKNSILDLGFGCYLEVLAIDSENTSVKAPRWMGIDLIQTSQVTRWALKSDNLENDKAVLRKYNPALSNAFAGQRETPSGQLIKWEMLLPLAEPKVELLPFFVDWSNSDIHPTDNLDAKCQIEKIEFQMQASSKSCQDAFNDFDLGITIHDAIEDKILLTLSGPAGQLLL